MAIPQTVIYLLVALLEILQPSAAISADYLQGGVPTDVFTIAPAGEGDSDVYVVTSESGEILRLEQADLVAHNYIVYSTEAPASIVSMSTVRSELRLPSRENSLPVGDYSWTPESGEVAGIVHLLVREAHVAISSQNDGALIMTR